MYVLLTAQMNELTVLRVTRKNKLELEVMIDILHKFLAIAICCRLWLHVDRHIKLAVALLL